MFPTTGLLISNQPMSTLPFPKRASAEGVIESTYYYVLFQILNYEHDRTRTRITRCYTTAGEALNFVRHMVREWEPHVDRDWEEFSDDDDDDKEEEENKVLLRVTTKYPPHRPPRNRGRTCL